MMAVDIEKLERVRRRVAGLRALAANNPSEHEAHAAAEMADKLAEEYGLEVPLETSTRSSEPFRDMTAREIAELMKDLFRSFSRSAARAARECRDFNSAVRTMGDIFGDGEVPVNPVRRKPPLVIHEVPTTDGSIKFRWACPDCGAHVELRFAREAVFDCATHGVDIIGDTFADVKRQPARQRCARCAEAILEQRPGRYRRD